MQRPRSSDFEDDQATVDMIALARLAGCHEPGRTVGPDFKVVGSDDIEDASQADPSLSTVRCDVGGFGRAIASTIVGWLE